MSSMRGSGSRRGMFYSALVAVAAVCLPAWIAASMPAAVVPLPPEPDSSRVIVPQIPGANRYQDDKVFLEHADVWSYDEQPDLDPEDQYQVLTGNVVFRKNDMYMYCDSAHFYEMANSFDAFGNVRMEQGDTLFVYADDLEYEGATELAVLYADPGNKVRLINRDVMLRTDVFNYDLAANVGYYQVGGVLTDRQNELTSLDGEYHPDTKYAYFSRNVRLKSLNGSDTLRMATDSLEYNTDTHIAELVAPTVITSADGEILSSSGKYNTDNVSLISINGRSW